MRVYMDTYFTPQRLESEIKDPKRSVFMAWMENQPVGYLNMYDGPGGILCKVQRPIELARIYVDRAWQGEGSRHALMSKALEVARSKNKMEYGWVSGRTIREPKPSILKIIFKKWVPHFSNGTRAANRLHLRTRSRIRTLLRRYRGRSCSTVTVSPTILKPTS